MAAPPIRASGLRCRPLAAIFNAHQPLNRKRAIGGVSSMAAQVPLAVPARAGLRRPLASEVMPKP